MSGDSARNLSPLDMQDFSDFEDDGDRATMPVNLADLAMASEQTFAATADPASEAPTVTRGLSVLACSEGDASATDSLRDMPQRGHYESAVHARSASDNVPAIPDMSHVPYLLLSAADVAWFEADASTGVVLACVDGTATVQTIVAMTALPPCDTLRIIGQLGIAGVLGLR